MAENKTILIVEDDSPLRSALQEKLKNSGYTVHSAKDGEEGLETASNIEPDLILLDIIMPKMDGLTMLEKMRDEEWGKDIPVIFLTNLVDNDTVGKAKDEMVSDYLVKSDWTLENVIAKINSVLGKSEKEE